MKPKLKLPIIYLDIDGVLLANENNLTVGAEGFIKLLADNFEVYWLTTHCMDGDPTLAVNNVNKCATENLKPYLTKFKPTRWNENKTEAIDFTKNFLWFDDDCYPEEKEALEKEGKLSSWIKIDIQTEIDQILQETKKLRKII